MPAANQAEYQVLVNWDDPKEQVLNTFEEDLATWLAAPGVQLNQYPGNAHGGTHSMQLESKTTNEIIFDGSPGFGTFVFGSGLGPSIGLIATRVVSGLDIGTTYTVYGWAFIPSGARHVRLTTSGFITEMQSTAIDTWVYLETTFEASATSQTVELYSIATTGSVGAVPPLVDDFAVRETGEDITCLIFGTRSPIEVNEGRDTPRALSAVATSESNFEFKNLDRLYSPNNPASPLYGKSASNLPVQIRAVFENRMYILYNGYIDKFVINHELPDFSTVEANTIDVMGQLAATNISTGLYQNIRTGEAIGKVLDEIKWPEGKRRIDLGSTVMDWWWAESTNAMEEVNRLIRAEGMPSIVYMDDTGNFVFRDRHHRYRDLASIYPADRFECADGVGVVTEF